MPGKHNAGGCMCCDICTSNETARQILLAQLGLSTITASGGPVVGTATADWKQLTCAPIFPDGSTDPSYPAFDFSGSTSSAISASPAGAGYTVCPPYFTSSENPLGALEHACVSSVLNARGFGFRTGSSCDSYLGSNTIDYFGSFRASVVFTCVSGVSKYVLGISTSFILFIIDNSYFTALPTTGNDWTRTGTGWTGTFTRDGSDADNGASLDFSFVRYIAGGAVYNMTASTWVNNPTTSVTAWVPDPVIDWTGLTHVGTASLT